jgi:hypothetical protein
VSAHTQVSLELISNLNSYGWDLRALQTETQRAVKLPRKLCRFDSCPAHQRPMLYYLSYLLWSYGFSLLQGAKADNALPLLLEALGIECRLENRDT